MKRHSNLAKLACKSDERYAFGCKGMVTNMKLMVLILNKIDSLEYLLEGLSSAGIGGATIIDSAGLAMTLSKMESSFISSSIRSLFTGSGSEEDNKTIISVIKDDQLDIARRVVYSTVGDLSKPNTGILFTVPIDFVEGTKKKGSLDKEARSQNPEARKKSEARNKKQERN